MTEAGKPTPTQEEQDAFARGARPGSHAHDGSPIQHQGVNPTPEVAVPGGMNFTPPEEEVDETKKEDPPSNKNKSAEADRNTASYKTRSSQAEKTKKSDKERE